MNPVSKSLASSGLLNTIETVQGMFPSYLSFGSYVCNKFPTCSVLSRKGKRKESRTRLPSPREIESESELESESEKEVGPLPKRCRHSKQDIGV